MKNCFVVDVDRCLGCKSCHMSCKMENGVALGANRIMTRTVGPMGVFPKLRLYFLPVMCQHCEHPTCVEVCPTGACWQNTETGLVLIDKTQCIGCQGCHTACPYDVNTFNKELRVMDKCDTCISSREKGEQPACIRNCIGEAIFFGDLDDPNSEVSRRLASVDPQYVHTLPDRGNAPTTRYILHQGTWSEKLPQEWETGLGGRSV